MLALAFIVWWYGDGWQGIGKRSLAAIKNLADFFSIKLLLATLFKPWRRIVSAPGIGLSGRFQALVNNTISRMIGFIVRVAVLCFAFLLTALFVVISVVQLILWPLLPLAVILTLILGFIK